MPPPPWRPSEEDLVQERLNALRKPAFEIIENEPIFELLASADNTTHVQTTGVKFLRDKTGKFHFLDTKRCSFHYQYCKEILSEQRTLPVFNDEVYSGKDRSALYGTLVHYRFDTSNPSSTIRTLELNPADPMTDLPRIVELFKQVQQRVYEGTNLKFRPTSPAQMAIVSDPAFPLPKILPSEFLGHTVYIPVVLGCRSGEVRFLSDLVAKKQEIPADSILVLDSIPNDLPPVQAVISGEVLPPLCHISLLCQNRRTPCCYLKDLERCHKHKGTTMTVRVLANTIEWSAGALSPGEQTPGPLAQLAIAAPVMMPRRCVLLTSEDATNPGIVGSKAAQCARILSVLGPCPHLKGAFVIPMGAYLFSNPSVSELVKGFTWRGLTAAQAKPKLLQAQELILKHPVQKGVINNVIELFKEGHYKAAILRSSTNVEDLEGFNGAGLYESVVVKDVTNLAEVEAAIKRVWASLWSERAQAERSVFQIDKELGMAVLVQPYLSDVVQANAVAITRNPYHDFHYGILVNALAGGGDRATEFKKGRVPEQAIIHLSRTPGSVDVELLNSAWDGKPVLQTADFPVIAAALQKLHQKWFGLPISANTKKTLDVELLLVGEKRELVVLQARPLGASRAPEHGDLRTM